jgi:hypothetical protein
VEALGDALRSTGLDVVVTDIVATQPWILESGVRLLADGAVVDVFVLSGPDAVSAATATRKNGPASVQPPADVALWLNGTAFIILHDAPKHAGVSDAISSLLGPPQFTTITGPQPPRPPEALPATGDGSLTDDTDGTLAWVWGVVATVAGAAMLAGGVYSLRLRRRSAR